jgi:hypothetical protein
MDSSKTTNLTLQLPEVPREARLENPPEYAAPDECIRGIFTLGTMHKSCSRSSTMVITRARPSPTTNPTEIPENARTVETEVDRFSFCPQIRQEGYIFLLFME